MGHGREMAIHSQFLSNKFKQLNNANSNTKLRQKKRSRYVKFTYHIAQISIAVYNRSKSCWYTPVIWGYFYIYYTFNSYNEVEQTPTFLPPSFSYSPSFWGGPFCDKWTPSGQNLCRRGHWVTQTSNPPLWYHHSHQTDSHTCNLVIFYPALFGRAANRAGAKESNLSQIWRVKRKLFIPDLEGHYHHSCMWYPNRCMEVFMSCYQRSETELTSTDIMKRCIPNKLIF